MTDRLQQLLIFLEKFPDDSFTMYSIGYEYLQMGELEKAVTHFQKLRNREPDYVGLYYHLGKTLERLENRAGAKEAFEAGIQVAKEAGVTRPLEELQRALQQWEDEDLWD